MSFTADGQWISCDGPGCTARAKTPVGLREVLAGTDEQAHSVKDWLFVSRQQSWLHYCPACVPATMESLVENGNERKDRVR